MLNKEKPVIITVDEEKCVSCGKCIEVCSGGHLFMQENKVKINENSLFGCVQCGNCMMQCPTNSIKISAEGVSEEAIFNLQDNLPDFEAIKALFKRRRSIRKFKKQEIPKEIIEKIIDAASAAPMSIPPSEVKVLVINGFDKVQNFADDLTTRFDKFVKIMNPFVLNLFKPFLGKTKHKIFSEFVMPLLKELSKRRKNGEDHLFYNAPCVILFYGTEVCLDKEDQIIASTYAQIAAEAMGLGTCVIGSVIPAIDAKLREKYGINKTDTLGTAFVLGYPDQKFTRGINRKFNYVSYI